MEKHGYECGSTDTHGSPVHPLITVNFLKVSACCFSFLLLRFSSLLTVVFLIMNCSFYCLYIHSENYCSEIYLRWTIVLGKDVYSQRAILTRYFCCFCCNFDISYCYFGSTRTTALASSCKCWSLLHLQKKRESFAGLSMLAGKFAKVEHFFKFFFK